MPDRRVSLRRALSKAGAATRTEATDLVTAGRVRVGGRVVLDPALRVDPARDRIELDGRDVGDAPAPATARVLAVNKPRGVVTTRSDPEGRPTAWSLLPPDGGRLRFVGRLDRASAGLLLATDDTRLAAALEDPRAAVERVYRVKVRPRVGEDALTTVRAGVVVGRRRARPASVEVESHGPRSSWLRVTLTEGVNREIRRLAAAAGLEVEHLVRVSFGPVALGDLPPGRARELPPAEVATLRAALQGRGAPSRGPRRFPSPPVKP